MFWIIQILNVFKVPNFKLTLLTNTHVLQIEFAMIYSCEYQNEIQSDLWSLRNVMLFTAALTYKSVCKTFLIVSDSHDKDKDTIGVFVWRIFYNHFDDPGAVHDIIWSDGSSSEFKNKFIMKFLQSLSQKHKRPFSWK